ncbi:MAG: hypothetical protein WDM91_09975 [Rhizomicrobium sp.]
MTARDFDRTANAVATQTFAERLGRGQPLPPSPAAVEQPARHDAYRAYGAMAAEGIAETCDIQGWMENTTIAQGTEVQYRFLMRTDYVGEEQIKLFLPDCIVVIDGAHLRDLRKKLARRQVTFVQQYSPCIWQSTPPKGEAIVERISIVRPGPITL